MNIEIKEMSDETKMASEEDCLIEAVGHLVRCQLIEDYLKTDNELGLEKKEELLDYWFSYYIQFERCIKSSGDSSDARKSVFLIKNIALQYLMDCNQYDNVFDLSMFPTKIMFVDTGLSDFGDIDGDNLFEKSSLQIFNALMENIIFDYKNDSFYIYNNWKYDFLEKFEKIGIDKILDKYYKLGLPAKSETESLGKLSDKIETLPYAGVGYASLLEYLMDCCRDDISFSFYQKDKIKIKYNKNQQFVQDSSSDLGVFEKIKQFCLRGKSRKNIEDLVTLPEQIEIFNSQKKKDKKIKYKGFTFDYSLSDEEGCLIIHKPQNLTQGMSQDISLESNGEFSM